MMLFDGKGGVKLRVVCKNDCVVLTPNAKDPYEEHSRLSINPTTGSVLEGQVILSLPTAKKCKKIRVELIGRQNIAVQGQYETHETMHSTLEIDTGAQTLGPGDHRFAFTFVIDATATPYERCSFGRTYHKVIATAPGLGKLGGDLKADQGVALVVNPSETGGLPPGFSLETETYNDVLGPVGATLSSKYLLVAGYLKLGLVLPSINQNVRLEDVKIYLYQTYNLQSYKNEDLKDVKRVTIPLWSLKDDSKQPLGVFSSGQEFSVVQQFRLKDDDLIRATTSEASNTGIRVSHKLAVIIHYVPLVDNPQAETRELKITTDATVTSCCCVVEYLQLPQYSQRPTKEDLDATFLGLCSSCLCKLAESKKIVDQYGIPAEDIKAAQLRLEQTEAPWKDDEEFRKAIQTEGFCTRGLNASPYPPSYLSSARSVFASD